MLHRATGVEDNSLERLEATLAAAIDCLLRQLRPVSSVGEKEGGTVGIERGYWIGELEADTTLESDYIFFLYFLGREEHRHKIEKLAAYILSRQSEDGTWNIWQGGEGNLSATVKAYVALRIAGHSKDEPAMVRAREAILRMGGVEKVNSFTKFYLALLDQLDWDDVPAIPPEVILIPRFFYINIYEISYWSRAILVPLSILYAKRATRPPEEGSLIRELLTHPGIPGGRPTRGPNGKNPDPAGNGNVPLERLAGASGNGVQSAELQGMGRNGHSDASPFHEDALGSRVNRDGALPPAEGEGDQGLFSWAGLFLLTDRILKLAEKTPVKPLRKLALKKAEEWMVARFEDSDGLGAIFPSMINSLMALVALGYRTDHPLVLRGMREVAELEIEEDGLLRLQPCLSPIWDTAKAVNALHEAGLPSDHESLVAACRWLVSKEVRKPGDWKIRIPHVEVSGWYFQFRNEFYPDVDDTSAVLMALERVDPDRVDGVEEAIARGIDWILNMQCSNGGWAAFDVNVQREILTKVPYADHNAMLDPPCADITGRCLELLGRFPELRSDPRVEASIRKGVEFLKSFQEEDGAWYGRWGVNYIYGTWQAIKGLVAVGEAPTAEYIRRAVTFLKSHQNPDGGWGETCATYDNPELRGRGTSTASQTAWALMGLIAAGETHSPEVERGVRFLLDHQAPDGNWEEDHWTGTGFPGVFYLKYHLYRLYFPLFALGMYRNALRGVPATGKRGRRRALRLPARTPTARRRALRSLLDLVNSE